MIKTHLLWWTLRGSFFMFQRLWGIFRWRRKRLLFHCLLIWTLKKTLKNLSKSTSVHPIYFVQNSKRRRKNSQLRSRLVIKLLRKNLSYFLRPKHPNVCEHDLTQECQRSIMTEIQILTCLMMSHKNPKIQSTQLIIREPKENMGQQQEVREILNNLEEGAVEEDSFEIMVRMGNKRRTVIAHRGREGVRE